MGYDPFTRRRGDTLPTGCIVALVMAVIPLPLGLIAFEIWWRLALFEAVLKYLHG